MQTKTETQLHVIGRGIFTWLRSERVTDRYGSCFLMADGCNSTTGDPRLIPMDLPPNDQQGRLSVRVIEPRESTHIGDFFRGLSPKIQEAGKVFVLGEGKAFQTSEGDIIAFGCQPNAFRESDWLDPKAMYNVHESLVELLWEPA